MPDNNKTVPLNPKLRARPSTAARPFTLEDEAHFRLIARQIFREDGQLTVLTRQRVLLLDKLKTVDVKAFRALVESLELRGGGALLWFQERTALALSEQFIDFVHYQLGQITEPPLSFRSNTKLESAVFTQESIIVHCVHLGELISLESVSFSVKEIFASNSIKCMSDAIDQLAILSNFRRESELLLDRCLPSRNGDLRGKAADLMTLVLSAYGAGDMQKIERLSAVAQGKMIAAKKVGGVLPELPNGLVWPEEQFKGSPEHNKHNGIISFLVRVWMPVISTGLVHRGHLAICDNVASKALLNYLHNGGHGRRAMPENVFIPQQRQRNSSAPVKRQIPQPIQN